jgi:hypothetical protein
MLIRVAATEPDKHMLQAASAARLKAASQPPYTGFGTAQDQLTIMACRQIYKHTPELAATVLFTRDEGMHASGWWKNPDYERCEHLSLSFYDMSHRPRAQDHARARLWCLALFGAERVRYLWVEPPFSPDGKTRDVYHYRLFLAPDWRLPVLPRKEVYTKMFTELGWKSWSDVQGDEPTQMETPP